MGQRHVVRVVLFSVVTAVAAVALVAAVGLLRVAADGAIRARATTHAVGQITPGFVPGDGTAFVSWRDADDHEQLTEFVLDDPGVWHAGQTFRLRYELDEGKDPNAGPLLADLPPDRTNVVAEEAGARTADQPSGWDYWWPSAVIGGVVLLVLAAWVVRWLLNRTAAAREPVDMRVVFLRGHNRVAVAGGSGIAEVMIASLDTPIDAEAAAMAGSAPGVWWQRVYWDPALVRITPGQAVAVRRLDGFARRAVLEPEPGVRIWPAGRMRRRAVRGLVHVVQPRREHPSHGGSVRPPAAVWWVPVAAGVLGAARGHVLADAPLVVVGLLVLVTFVWSWTGPAPEHDVRGASLR